MNSVKEEHMRKEEDMQEEEIEKFNREKQQHIKETETLERVEVKDKAQSKYFNHKISTNVISSTINVDFGDLKRNIFDDAPINDEAIMVCVDENLKLELIKNLSKTFEEYTDEVNKLVDEYEELEDVIEDMGETGVLLSEINNEIFSNLMTISYDENINELENMSEELFDKIEEIVDIDLDFKYIHNIMKMTISNGYEGLSFDFEELRYYSSYIEEKNEDILSVINKLDHILISNSSLKSYENRVEDEKIEIKGSLSELESVNKIHMCSSNRILFRRDLTSKVLFDGLTRKKNKNTLRVEEAFDNYIQQVQEVCNLIIRINEEIDDIKEIIEENEGEDFFNQYLLLEEISDNVFDNGEEAIENIEKSVSLINRYIEELIEIDRRNGELI